MTGVLELGVATAVATGPNRPDRVTVVLGSVFAEIGGLATDINHIWRLASGSREWLLQRAAALFWRESGWFQARCEACNAAYDVPLRLDAAPRKPAAEPFPVVSVRTSLGLRDFEVPNGLHEAALAQQCPQNPTRALLAKCGLGPEARSDAEAFCAADLRVIEEALDLAAPDIADDLTITCPNCNAPTAARIDPLEFAFPDTQTLLREVHSLAATYHWSEEAILALPSVRRRAYAELIRQEAHK
jgi:hypothetical protein